MNKKRSIFLILMLVVVPLSLFAQQNSIGGPIQRPAPGAIRGRIVGPAAFPVTITADIGGATVYLNGHYEGQLPFSRPLPAGSYELRISAHGYNDYRTVLQVHGPTHINARLQPIRYSLTVTANINGATVFLNGQNMGNTPLTATLQPGEYRLRVEAGGYRTYNATVTVNRNTSVNAYLQAELVRIHVQIPDQFLNPRGGRTRARREVELFVDNHRENRETFDLRPGDYTIRFESGGFMVQRRVHFDAGRAYTLTPELAIRVR